MPYGFSFMDYLRSHDPNHGGIIVYLKNVFKVKKIELPVVNSFESLAIKFRCGKKTILLLAVYQPDELNSDDFAKFFKDKVDNILETMPCIKEPIGSNNRMSECTELSLFQCCSSDEIRQCCSDSCCLVLVVRKPIRLDGPVKTGRGCAKADRLTDRPSENRPLVVRKPIRLDGPVKTGQGCAKADRLTDRPSENRPLVVRKPIRLDGPVKTGQGCAKADRLTDRPSENRPWVL
ncbi:hypothetical protein HELRODRAFT_183751 [Helobdella robusta]|uniref:Uncharacterized protein n=1 Tax=Helobdella robusta TaxID=6412 RepID=T1FK52_HELRO|nr:hypothetical protein HELRODRAFT_183751 [Helobdella robusta]ESO10335.1 hypothetical protein HELRODRAFT_183751 [Helobdella robusta]